MKTKFFGLLVIFLLLLSLTSFGAENSIVEFDTSLGIIEVELFNQEAPIGSKNFITYVNKGFYNNLIFHRVIKGFMIQGGGFNSQMIQKKARLPIKNEANNGKKNLRGTLSYARTRDIHSATSQFFINLVDNGFLDHKGEHEYGYAVFGKVIKGMDVVDKIATVETGRMGMYNDVPVEPVVIKKATLKK